MEAAAASARPGCGEGRASSSPRGRAGTAEHGSPVHGPRCVRYTVTLYTVSGGHSAAVLHIPLSLAAAGLGVGHRRAPVGGYPRTTGTNHCGKPKPTAVTQVLHGADV